MLTRDPASSLLPRSSRRLTGAAAFVMVATLALMPTFQAQETHSQQRDADFEAGIEVPAYEADGPRVCIDEAHNNFHTMDGRFGAFGMLLKADGYRVVPGKNRFSTESLKACRILVIANAQGQGASGNPAFSAEEIEAVNGWVRAGGSILLIADHAPFGAAASNLGEVFGVEMLNGWVRDPDHMDAPNTGPYIIRFDRESGLIGDHPITRGRTEEERVQTIVTYGGQALKVGSSEGVLISFSPAARSVLNPRTPDPDTETAVPGWAHAVAVNHGKGRAVIVGEAAFFSAQVIRGPAAKAAGVEALRVGMTREDTSNRQFVLNTLHWLSSLI